MRPIALIFAAALLAAVPAAASPVLQQDGLRADQLPTEQPRWQGRQHWLYDDAAAQDSMAKDAATDGHSANAQGNCRSVPVRVKRSDGVTTIRRINRCE